LATFDPSGKTLPAQKSSSSELLYSEAGRSFAVRAMDSGLV